jgi:hypothetical protein
MMRKANRADAMFIELVRHMNAAQTILKERKNINTMQLPSWL